jgi:hypothetical protein
VPSRPPKPPKIDSFDLRPGRKIGPRYEVVQLLGRGVEGEVYQIRETDTSIMRAAKLYFPHRDPKHRSTIWYAQKLNTLRHCPIVLQYHHTEVVKIKRGDQRMAARALISELAEGEQLEKWIERHPGKRVPPFRALHVLYHLVRGLEAIHALGEYHADVHSQNILIKPVGIGFEIKLVDFYDWGKPAGYKQRQDIWDTIKVFHECLGGAAAYGKVPPELKAIVLGTKRKLILQRFPTMTILRQHLEKLEWTSLL